MAYRIALLDTDINYGRALMEYINMRSRIPLEMLLFTDEKTFAEYNNIQNLSMVLVGDAYSFLEWNCKTIILTESREKLSNGNTIFRYQKAEVILEQILKELTGVDAFQKDVSEFCAVYSPVGRCGKSMLARELSGLFNNSVLVVWDGFLTCGNCEYDGARFLYCLKSRNADFEGELKRLGEKKVVIPGPKDYRDIKQMDASDIRWFKEQVKKRGNGVCVVFDIGSTVLGDLSLLKEFDHVYMPYLSDEASRNKVENWENLVTAQWKVEELPTVHFIDISNKNVREVAQDILRGGRW